MTRAKGIRMKTSQHKKSKEKEVTLKVPLLQVQAREQNKKAVQSQRQEHLSIHIVIELKNELYTLIYI